MKRFILTLSTRALLICTAGNTQQLGVGVRKLGIWCQKSHGKLDEEGQGPLHPLLSSESIAALSARGTGLTQRKLHTVKETGDIA